MIRVGTNENETKQRRFQVHFWIGIRDYEFIRGLAEEEQDTIASVMRRVIRAMRLKHDGVSSRSDKTI